MTLDIAKFKQALEAEKKSLEADLSEVGQKNPDQNGDWEVKPEEVDLEFHDEAAGAMEDLEEREATEVALEERLGSVDQALARIESGTYGDCAICGAKIETERLEANPAAQTCKLHRDQEPARS